MGLSAAFEGGAQDSVVVVVVVMLNQFVRVITMAWG